MSKTEMEETKLPSSPTPPSPPQPPAPTPPPPPSSPTESQPIPQPAPPPLPTLPPQPPPPPPPPPPPTPTPSISSTPSRPPALPATKASKKRRHSNSNDFLERLPTFLKLRKITVAGAPKLPLTGYVRYMNDRREIIRKEHPDKNAMEHTKIIAEEWHQLPDNRKAPYIKLAETEKQRYVADLYEFLREHPDVIAKEIAKNKQRKKSKHNNSSINSSSTLSASSSKDDNNFNKTIAAAAAAAVSAAVGGTVGSDGKNTQKHAKVNNNNNSNNNSYSPPSSSTPASVSSGSFGSSSYGTTGGSSTFNGNGNGSSLAPIVLTPGEISIYTNEFLEHNKICDMEVRMLRKNKSDLEQQCAVLEKHVESMKTGCTKIINENIELMERLNRFEIYFNKVRQKLVIAFNSLAIPVFSEGATDDNIDDYLSELQKMATANTHGPACLNKAKDIIRKLDLSIQI